MAYTPSWKYRWIKTYDELKKVIPLLSQEAKLGVDTETAGWREGNEKLCLIQIGVPSKTEVLLIDALSVEDLSPLEEIFRGSLPIKIAHNASFEERQFARHKLPFKGVVDTLTMARQLRPDLLSHALRVCCKEILGFELSKEEQTSDWSLRPLSDSQVMYAVGDAEVAVLLYDALMALQESLVIDSTLDVSGLMGLLKSTVEEKYELTRDVAAKVAYCSAREENIRSKIKQKLEEGAPPYKGEHGEAEVKKIKKNEINIEKVREVFPEISELVIQEFIEKKRMVSVMEEYGIPTKRIDDVTDQIGFTSRLVIKLSEDE